MEIGPAIGAAENHGTPGYFVAQGQRCGKTSCTWYGEFELSGGAVARSSTAFYGSDAGMTEGTTVAAVDTGDPFGVYKQHGSRQWIETLIILLIGVSLLGWLTVTVLSRWSGRSGAAPASEAPDQPGSWLGPGS
jgi:hypothetical protein